MFALCTAIAMVKYLKTLYIAINRTAGQAGEDMQFHA
jgi:hypothetical protein